jgi:kexin
LLAACGGGKTEGDPMLAEQWYLTGEHEGQPAVHLDAQGLDVSGAGVVVGIVDDGLDIDHEDLSSAVLDFNRSYLPETFRFQAASHGTAVAGIIAARADNGLGGRGVAPGASLVAYNVLRAPATANFADALSRDFDRVDVYNNSWGDFNGWGVPIPLRTEIETALLHGVTLGRQGLGAVYVFSAGNGAIASGATGLPADNVNFSGLVNNRYTISVCAVDVNGHRATYSEKGATLWVCAPSNSPGVDAGVVTTDVSGPGGYNDGTAAPKDLANANYTRRFGGTSAAAPMVSGVVALMLEANPGLGWRDVKAILALTAKRNHEDDPDWQRNSAGVWVNHNYGFGLVQAHAAVDLARRWRNLPVAETLSSASVLTGSIPDDGTVFSDEIRVSLDELVEFVDVEVNVPDHARLSDLDITLVSPSGTRSVLAELHKQQFDEFRLRNWRFGTARHLGERSAGPWRLELRDRRPGYAGTLMGWRLQLHVAPGRSGLML